MLKKIRKSARNYAIKVLFIVLAIVFAMGVGDFTQRRSDVVAKVGDNKIFLEDFLQARQEFFGQLESNISSEQKNATNYNVLIKIITQSLIKQETESLGIKIAPEVVVEYVKNDRNFSKNGEFDIENYKKTLEYNNLSEDRLLEIASNQIASRFLLDSLGANLPLKSTLSNYLYGFLSEKRTVTVTKIDLAEKELFNILELELQNFYQKNPDLFKSKERRSFDYLYIDPKEMKKEFKINDQDLIKEFEENKEEYSLPETRDFYHFLAPSEEIANQIVQKLKTEQDPTKLAKEFVAKRVVSEEFKNQPAQSFLSSLNLSLFSLSENEVPNPTKSELGWHVFKILKIHPKRYKKFAESKDEIRDNLSYKLIQGELTNKLEALEDDIASGANIEEIANKHKIKLKSFKNVTLDESNIQNEIDKLVFDIAFNAQEMEESEVISLDNDQGYVLVKLLEIVPQKSQEYEQVKNDVKFKYVKQLKDDISFDVAQAFANNPREDILEFIHKKYKIDSAGVKVSIFKENITRPEVGSNNLPESFVSQLFNLELNKFSNPYKLANGVYIVANVNNIITGDKLNSEIHNQINNISEMNYKNEIYDQYISYLRNKYNVQLYFDAIADN